MDHNFKNQTLKYHFVTKTLSKAWNEKTILTCINWRQKLYNVLSHERTLTINDCFSEAHLLYNQIDVSLTTLHLTLSTIYPLFVDQSRRFATYNLTKKPFIMVRWVKMAGIDARGFWILSDFREFFSELMWMMSPLFNLNFGKIAKISFYWLPPLFIDYPFYGLRHLGLILLPPL